MVTGKEYRRSQRRNSLLKGNGKKIGKTGRGKENSEIHVLHKSKKYFEYGKERRWIFGKSNLQDINGKF